MAGGRQRGSDRMTFVSLIITVVIIILYHFVHAVIIFTDKKPTYRDYVLNLERLTVFISNKPRLESPALESEIKCGSVSRSNNALFHPKLRMECNGGGSDTAVKARYVYIMSTPVPNRWDRIFNSIFCQVYVY